MNKQEIKEALYRLKDEIKRNEEAKLRHFKPEIVLKDDEANYLIDLINNDDHLEEICEPCSNGEHDKCWKKRCKYRCLDSILIYCTCSHDEKKKVAFKPLTFCYLRDTLDDLSKLPIAEDLDYIPFGEYVDELDKLIKYFEDQKYLEPCEDDPLRVYSTNKFKEYVKFGLMSNLKLEIKCKACSEGIILEKFETLSTMKKKEKILKHYLRCKEINKNEN